MLTLASGSYRSIIRKKQKWIRWKYDAAIVHFICKKL